MPGGGGPIQRVVSAAPLRLLEKETNSLYADGIAVSSNGFHGLAAAPGIYLLEDAMDVVPDRELGKIQSRGNLFVCKTLGNESDQLLLAQSQIRFRR